MSNHLANEALRRIRHLADLTAPPEPEFLALARRASLSRTLLKGAEMHPINGVDAEYFQETARRAGKPYDCMQPIIGWEKFTRADTVLPGSAGGYTTGTAVPGAVDALRPVMACAALGATFIETTGNLALPRQTGIAGAQWQGSESTVVTETQQTLSNLGLTPHTVGVYSEISRQALVQSNIEAVVERDLIRAIANAADIGALYGTGESGQPVGITVNAGGTGGIGTFSGTSATVATFTSAFVALGDGLDDDSGGVAANRTVAGLLRQRPETTGSTRTLWDGKLTDGTVIDYPARSSTALSSGNAIVGNWKYLVIATWGGGIELVINPYGDQVTGVNNFRQGVVGYRALLTMDAGAVYPSAFAFAAAVT